MEKGTLIHRADSARFNLREIIEGEWVEAHFQPIVSLKRRRIVGLEGLSRGIQPSSRTLISPVELFHQADLQCMSLELDRLCRKKILDDFRGIHAHSPEFILSINLDASALDQAVVGSGHLRTQVAEMGLKPENIAIEIIESQVADLKELQRFVKLYRSYGFLIALDDVGAGHSNLNRIPLIKPDILKIDRFLVQDIQDDFYKQEVLKSLVQMARHLGTLIIAEGVETQAEAVCLLDMDVDLIQGFYFSKPQPRGQLAVAPIRNRMEELGAAFKWNRIKKIGVKRLNMDRYYATILEIQMELNQSHPAQFDFILNRLVRKFAQVETVYLLDEAGIQASETVINRARGMKRNPVIFHPSPKGADHTMKDYYYILMEAGLNKTSYVTEPYLSMASGTSCVTLSSIFKNTDGNRYVLCLDINTEALVVEPAE